MGSLGAMELLAAWERGTALDPTARALTLLEAADPETRGELEALSPGRRNARLLALREAILGRRIEALVDCPRCGESLELDLQTADLRADRDPAPEGRLALVTGDYEVELRLPESRDLTQLAGRFESVEEGRHTLLRRCLLTARCRGEEVGPETLPEDVVAAVEERMAAADPQADIRLDLACAECGHSWNAPFDVLAFLWTELDAWARRLLGQIHCLATAYGWSEAEILALSPWRRQLYLEMANR